MRGKKVAVKKLSTREVEALASKARPRRPSAAQEEIAATARSLQQQARARGAGHAKVEVATRKGKPWATLSAPVAELEALLSGKRGR